MDVKLYDCIVDTKYKIFNHQCALCTVRCRWRHTHHLGLI